MLAALQRTLADLGFHTDIGTFILLFGLTLARLATAISLAPFLGGKSASGRIKIGLAALMSVLLFSSVVPQQNLGEITTLRVMSLLIKEAMIGATIGFLSQLVFYSVQMAGAMVDYGRGMSQATFFAPQLETNVSLLGQLQLQAALVLFLLLNGHLIYLRALADSYRAVPLLEFPKFGGGTMASAEQIARYTGDSLVVAIQLSAPVLITLFLIDISFGLLGKAAAGFHVHNESQPVKSLVGLGVVFLGLAYILNRMPGLFADMIREIDELVRHAV
jgi:flagellar biosynthesis protein FliR